MYVAWQALGIALTVAISQTIAAIGFPVLIIALIPLRWKLLPRFFTLDELRVLDAPTADSDVVLASLGGKPSWKGEDEKGMVEKGDSYGKTHDMARGEGAVRERGGAYTRE